MFKNYFIINHYCDINGEKILIEPSDNKVISIEKIIAGHACSIMSNVT